MDDKLTKLALDAGLLNYVDNETPRRYFVHGYADLEDVQKFAELIVKECLDIMQNCNGDLDFAIWKTKKNFGVEV